MKRCSEVMTENPVCCPPTDATSKAAQLMRTVDVGSIPVVESEQTKKLIGIVTDRDLAIQVVANERDPKSTQVGDVMTRDIITCHMDEDVQKAVDAMARHQLRRIPVVDNNQNLVGIISQADIATRVDKSNKTAEMVKEISQPAA